MYVNIYLGYNLSIEEIRKGVTRCFVNRTGNKLVITNIDLVKD